jgi:hypothetical protein
MRLSVIVRWVGHVWGVVSALFILGFMFEGHESMRPTAEEAVGLLLFPGGVVAGFAIAWWREGVGGLVTLGSLALFALWLFGQGHFLGPYFLLFAGPGFLHTANAAFGWWHASVEGSRTADPCP